MEGTTHPPGWHPDPHGRHEQRYWDGNRWTEHVSDGGVASLEAADASAAPQITDQVARAAEQINREPAAAVAAGHHVSGGGGSLLDEPILVVNQKAKLIELANEYKVFDREGTQIGMVEQVGQSGMKKVVRLLGEYDQYFTHNLNVTDAQGNLLLSLTRPRKVFKSKLHVKDASGGEVGSIIQQNVFGKIKFALEAGGSTVGSINAENWRAWNFSIRDETDAEVARITKTFEGVAKTMFTTADNYVLHVHRPLKDPLRSLVVASSLCVETALKQDARGLNTL